MIAPDMATMLGFVFTDAALPAGVLREILASSVERSFNATTVDGDTSTSDTVLAFATGAAQTSAASGAADPKLKAFIRAFDKVCLDLAHQLVRDGEAQPSSSPSKSPAPKTMPQRGGSAWLSPTRLW